MYRICKICELVNIYRPWPNYSDYHQHANMLQGMWLVVQVATCESVPETRDQTLNPWILSMKNITTRLKIQTFP